MFDLYQTVTDRIVAMLEQGVAPWRSPILGRTSAGHPYNLASGKPYRGVNVFLLAFTAWAKGYPSPHWLTFNQARQKGGVVKKGEQASMVVFWKKHEIEDKETGEAKTVPVLRYYSVFNTEQCDGVPAPGVPPFTPLDFRPIEAAAAIVSGYSDAPAVTHVGSRAEYLPLSDAVRLPDPTRFVSAEEYYGTLFHEFAHSTGHSRRLNRGIDTKLAPFGSPDYSREELVAEMAAAFLCGQAGIEPVTLENQAAYLQGWIRVLKGDKRLVITAAGAAQKAADWIRGERLTRQKNAADVDAGDEIVSG
ncbi:MAG: DUF1738 domain-containing protein [Phycisphaerales bacterium]|nr:DUF1738 domain-containing protein [Phycisphaerales bacterium]